MQIDDLFSQCVPVQSKQLRSLNLIASRFLQGRGDERALDGGDEDRVEVSRGSVAHSFDEFTHFDFEVIFQRPIPGFTRKDAAWSDHGLDHSQGLS